MANSQNKKAHTEPERRSHMKALKNDSSVYLEKIILAITNCYSSNIQPTNAQLMELYAAIGKNICEQGEKAFVVYLAEQLSEKFPALKGFSPRNLRRMREFYRTYKSNSQLMQKAQALSWTQNTVILEYCDTAEQREFYIDLATKQQLSKLALIKAIESGTHTDSMEKELSGTTAEVVAPVCDDTAEQGVDTTQTDKTACGAFVPVCEPPHQGGSIYRNRFESKLQYIAGYVNSKIDIKHSCRHRLLAVFSGCPPNDNGMVNWLIEIDINKCFGYDITRYLASLECLHKMSRGGSNLVYSIDRKSVV